MNRFGKGILGNVGLHVFAFHACRLNSGGGTKSLSQVRVSGLSNLGLPACVKSKAPTSPESKCFRDQTPLCALVIHVLRPDSLTELQLVWIICSNNGGFLISYKKDPLECDSVYYFCEYLSDSIFHQLLTFGTKPKMELISTLL